MVTIVLGAGDMTAEEKSPKSPPKLSFRAVMTDGVFLGGGAGFMSKKLPPLNADLVVEGCRAWPVGDVRPEKGAGLADCCGGEVNDREPNASPRPPSACAFDID